MKHRYNPLVYVALFVCTTLLSLGMFHFFPEFVEAHSEGRKGLDSLLAALPVALTSIAVLNTMGSSVETLGEYVKFNNFRLKAFNVFKTFSVTLSYGSIVRIDAKKLPLIGIYKIVVTSKNYPDPIPVSRLFLKHKQLFYTICTRTQRYNSEVLLDNDLQEFTEKYSDKFD